VKWTFSILSFFVKHNEEKASKRLGGKKGWVVMVLNCPDHFSWGRWHDALSLEREEEPCARSERGTAGARGRHEKSFGNAVQRIQPFWGLNGLGG